MAHWKRGLLEHLHANAFCMTINVRVQNDAFARWRVEGEEERGAVPPSKFLASTHTNSRQRLAGYRKHQPLRSKVGHVVEI